MIENIEQLKNIRPDLAESFENMTRDELLNQCYLECIDALNMESRVELFMSECTNNMSKTNYTLGSLKSLISENKESVIDDFCYDVCDEQEDVDILKEVKSRLKDN